MASKAVTRVTADWAKLASRMSEADHPKLNKLKAQFDATAVKISSLPESLPAIDWSHYKAHASDSKLVEEIEKKYSAIKVTKPQANPSRLQELQAAQSQDEARFKGFSEFARTSAESAEALKKKFQDMIPVKDMTLEDWTLTFPEWSFSIENPSIWPHYGRAAGLTREEAAAWEQPDPVPFATKSAWKDWEEKYKHRYK